MERQENYFLSWYNQDPCGIKTRDELIRYSTIRTTMELEKTRMVAQEELNAKDDQIKQLKDLLNKAIKERDEAQEKCKKLLLDQNFILQHKTVEEQEPNTNNGFPSSDGEESIVSSFEPPMQIEFDFPERTLPEKGKLLKAVLKAGPLLQTLLLAGELPQWRHPPPQLESFQIPPVILIPESSSQISCGNNLNRKRVHCDESNSKRETKYQRLLFP